MTPEHAALRRTAIGASEVAAIAGISSTPAIAQILRSKIDPTYQWEGNEYTDLGLALEPGLREMAAKVLGCRIVEAPWVRHDKHPNVAASPDGRNIYPDRRTRGLELKAIGRNSPHAKEYGEEGTDQIAQGHLCQVQVQMACSGERETDVCALIAGEFRTYLVKYDPELAAMLCETAQTWFTKHVTNLEPIPVDSTDAYSEYLAHKYPRDNGTRLQADDRQTSIIEAWKHAREQRIALEKHESGLYAELATILGMATALESNVGVVSYKSQNSAPKTDWKRLAADKGITEEEIKTYTTRGTHRVMRISKGNDNE